MKLLNLILVFLFCSISAQKNFSFDSLKIQEATDFFADDYGNIYLYKNKDFSFTKYDSLGKQQGKMMFTLPFKIQDVQNPLNIVLFSENAQEMKFIDYNLNEIQKIDLRKFGFVKMAYAEDLQQIWLLDESQKRLVQYNFREDKIINSYPFFIETDQVKDMIVFAGKMFLMTDKTLIIYDFKARKLFESSIENGRKLRRENEDIFLISNTEILRFSFPQNLSRVFQSDSAQIVDKNSGAYFELKRGKLYLYKLEK